MTLLMQLVGSLMQLATWTRFPSFPELLAKRAGDTLTNSQSCAKLRTVHLH